MTLPFHGKQPIRDETPSPREVIETDEEQLVKTGYEHFATITLQGTLASLRVMTTIHGKTERTNGIERSICRELSRRGARF